MAVTSVIKIGDNAVRRRAPRLAGDMRRAQIVDAACRFFAEHGFSGPTRDLAASIGVTQALLYRYFDSKTDLIDAVFADVFRGAWGEDAVARFDEAAGAATADRLAQVYGAMLPRMTATATRLLFRAGLESYAGPAGRSASVGADFVAAVVSAWRADEALPSLDVFPMLDAERELVSALHDAMIMIRVREHILHVERRLGDVEEARQVAETYDAGARSVLRRIHAEPERSGAAAFDAGAQVAA